MSFLTIMEENIQLHAQNHQLRIELSSLRKDAARYRWLREYDVDSYLAGGRLEDLDRSIDEAMAQGE